MFEKILPFTLLCILSANAYSMSFSLRDVVDQSASYSVTVNDVTMTVDSPQPGLLSNFPDGVEGLDFGLVSTSGLELTSFDLSFDTDMFVTGYVTSFILGDPVFDIEGTGVLSLNNSFCCLPQLFNGEPLLFLAGENYTFSVQSPRELEAVTFGSIEASVSTVPIPAAAWLFGSALLGLGAVKRKKA
jgi:hypothetical protein